MISINFFVNSRYHVSRQVLREKAINFLQLHQVDNVIVDIHIVGVRKIKELNENEVGHHGSTDVLSFPQYDFKEEKFITPSGVPKHLGDIMINFNEAVKQAGKKGKLVDDQLWFYIEHGLLHLLGYHHDDGM